MNLDSNNTFLLCDLDNDLEYYKDNNNKKVFRLLTCSEYVRPGVKQIVFRTRDANSAINIMKLAKVWIEKQERPSEFHSHISSFTSFPNTIGKSGKSYTINIDFTLPIDKMDNIYFNKFISFFFSVGVI